MCSQEMLEREDFQTWVERLGHPRLSMQRKLWEWAFVCQALYEREKLKPGMRGLCFAVGTEPLPALFVNYGCEILATDLDTDNATKLGWVDGVSHASKIEDLNKSNICFDDLLKKQVSFEFVDMNHIPTHLTNFDFIWSVCSMEHLGSMILGKQFVYKAMNCLKPGGIAVHTMEYNVSSNQDTLEDGYCAIFRKRDIQEMTNVLHFSGHNMEVDFTEGKKKYDLMVDSYPYGSLGRNSNGESGVHLRLNFDKYVMSSYGIIIQKGM